MSEQLMDIHLELDPITLAGQRDQTQAIAEASRHAALEQARHAGGIIRHPDPRDVHVSRGVTPAGFDVVLVATRWLVDLPD